jgi:hypothetical protein
MPEDSPRNQQSSVPGDDSHRTPEPRSSFFSQASQFTTATGKRMGAAPRRERTSSWRRWRGWRGRGERGGWRLGTCLCPPGLEPATKRIQAQFQPGHDSVSRGSMNVATEAANPTRRQIRQALNSPHSKQGRGRQPVARLCVLLCNMTRLTAHLNAFSFVPCELHGQARWGAHIFSLQNIKAVFTLPFDIS